MIARKRLLNCQKRLSQSFRRSARMYLGELPDTIKKYSLEYYRELNSYKKIIFKNNILSEVLGSQIILCGDYHSSSQAQRTVLRILREIMPRIKKNKKTLYLGLEIIRAQDNVWTQQFLHSQISELSFLHKTGFQDWGFNWQNYAPILNFAKEWGVPVVGLSPNRMGSLKSRDVFAAQVIANWAKSDPNSVLFCLMGDLHLAQKHLPQEIKTELVNRSLTKRVLTLHQNHDELYWKLVSKKRENKGEVIQLQKDVFCILNTAPWIKLQSHLKWIEERPGVEDSSDPSDSLFQLVQEIAYFLGLKKNSLGTGADFILRASQNSRTYFSYSDQIFYLAEPNLNHLAKISAQYVHAKLSHFDKTFDGPNLNFYPLIWTEVLGYLGSKIINPKRKCFGIKDLESSSEPEMKMAYRFIQGIKRRPDPLELESPARVAQILGQLLGQAMFDLILKNKVSMGSLRELFKTNFGSDSETLYWDWCQKVDTYSLRNFSFREKL